MVNHKKVHFRQELLQVPVELNGIERAGASFLWMSTDSCRLQVVQVPRPWDVLNCANNNDNNSNDSNDDNDDIADHFTSCAIT